MFKKIKELLFINKTLEQKKLEVDNLNKEIEVTKGRKEFEIRKLDEEVNREVNQLKVHKENEVKELDLKFKYIEAEIAKKDVYIKEIENYKIECEKLEKKVVKENKSIDKLKYIHKTLQLIVDKYSDMDILSKDLIQLSEECIDLDPTITLKLNCMDVKELRKAFKENQRLIEGTLERYSGRYNTKANKAIYDLMVIALKAEQQNILYNLKYEKLDKSIDDIKNITEKYLKIAEVGNQSIAGTLIKFINEIEYLFIKSAEIEYEYYIKKEEQKQEQARLREQMKQEAEEKRLLEKQQKQVEKEEEKYINEIKNIEELIKVTEDIEKINQLNSKIEELNQQLDLVEDKKEEIIKRQNGKAGYVYVISNLGSFGDKVFKVGMTRRLDPMERIKELSDASVPFEFDVHSFIFSDDAPMLEKKLHEILNDKRVNKINLRREFFNVDINELGEVVQEINPTAEFNKTMLAEQYRQSLAMEDLEELVI